MKKLYLVIGAFLLSAASYGTPAQPAEPPSALESLPEVGEYRLILGPIDGLNEAPREAPPYVVVPRGVTVTLHQVLSSEVEWEGASEVESKKARSTAVAHLDSVGLHEVRARFQLLDGGSGVNSVLFQVADVAVDQVRLAPIELRTDPVLAGGTPSPEEAGAVLRYTSSIASLERAGSGSYRTSVWRELRPRTTTYPGGMEPLLDWRLDGEIVAKGERPSLFIARKGRHAVSVGPRPHQQSIEVQAYEVRIDLASDQGVLERGEPLVLRAETDPPGYASEVTWLARLESKLPRVFVGRGATLSIPLGGVSAAGPGTVVDVMADSMSLRTSLDRDLSAKTTALSPSSTAVKSFGEKVADLQPPTPPEILSLSSNVGSPGDQITVHGSSLGGKGIEMISGEGGPFAGPLSGFPLEIEAISPNGALLQFRVLQTPDTSAPSPLVLRGGGGGGDVTPPAFPNVELIDSGTVRGWCAADIVSGSTESPTLFTTLSDPCAESLAWEQVGQELHFTPPAASGGVKGFLALGFSWTVPTPLGPKVTYHDVCWIPGKPSSGYICFTAPIPQSTVALILAAWIDTAFKSAGIKWTVQVQVDQTTGDSFVVVACNQSQADCSLLELESLLWGFLILDDCDRC